MVVGEKRPSYRDGKYYNEARREKTEKKVSSGKVLNIHSQQHNYVAKKNAESYPKITLKVIEKQNFKGLTNSS